MHRVFKQSYTEEALEAWLLRLKAPWEEQFSKEALSLGRDFYKYGAIRSLELELLWAKAVTKQDRTEDYVVVEAAKERWCFRGSYKTELHNEALAAATLYEIEELLAEALPSLPLRKAKKASSQVLGDLASSTGGPTPYPLCLDFKLESHALYLYPVWELTGERVSTFDPKPVSKQERALLIQLALQAKKEGFKAEYLRKAYVLRDLERVPSFLKQILPTWSFAKYALDSALNDLKLRILHAELKAFPASEYDFRLELSLYCPIKGERYALNKADQAFVLQARKRQNCIYLRDYGILDIRLEDKPSVERFLEQSRAGEALQMPNYRLLSLYPKIEALLAPELMSWKQKAEANHLSPTCDMPSEGHSAFSLLRPYQKAGVLWLKYLSQLGLHPLLADDMGLGKTLQVLSFLSLFAKRTGPSLVVCPSSVVSVWEKEIQRFFKDGIVCTSLVNDQDKPLVYKPGALMLYITSYAQLRRHQDSIKALSFEYAVLDEAQFIKNADSKTARAAYLIQAKHRIALSGTPIENHLQDIEAIFRFLMPGLLGTKKEFQTFYLKQPETAPALVKEQLHRFILRRLKEEAAPDLPSKTDMLLSCPLSPLQKHLYLRYCEKILQQLSLSFENPVSVSTISLLTALMRLRQICCAPFLLPSYQEDPEASFEHSTKLKILIETVPSILESGHKIVIFSQFTSLLEPLRDRLKALFPHIPLYYLCGKTQSRASLVDSFQSQVGPAIFLVSLKAGGTGITLHAADYVFLLDPWWNPAVEEQAINRIHRIGQKKPVFIYRLITPGTLEERIQGLQKFKHGLAEGVLSARQILQTLASAYGSLRELIEYKET
jgi:SNF2 family DNA or RNA helicase